MNIEHCDCLSWFSRRCESHKQDGETLSAQRSCNAPPASGDPAMAFGPSCDRDGPSDRRSIGSVAAAHTSGRLVHSATTRETSRAQASSTANTEPFDQLFVTPFVRAPQIVENLPALRHELQQPAARVVVLDMGLEVIRQIVDALRKKRNLYFWRTRITRLHGVRVNNLRLTCGRNRHRHQPFCLPARPATPFKLKTRLGTISPRSISAIATSCPPEATWTVPRMTAASRPRNKTV